MVTYVRFKRKSIARSSSDAFELVPLLELITVDEDVDLWTPIVLRGNNSICLFAVQFQPFILL